MADDVQQMVNALQGTEPIVPTDYTQLKTPPRWSDYAREYGNSGGTIVPFAGVGGPMTSEGALEMIMGLEPIVQVLRGAKDVTDRLGITKPMRSYDSKINVPREDKT